MLQPPQIFTQRQVEARQPASVEVKPSKEIAGRTSIRTRGSVVSTVLIVMDSSLDKLLSDSTSSNSSASSIISDSTQIVQQCTSTFPPVLTTTSSTSTNTSWTTGGSRTLSPCISIPCASLPMMASTTANTSNSTPPSTIPSADSMPPTEMAGKFLQITNSICLLRLYSITVD